LLRLQNIILEMVARGESLKATADRLCAEVESLLPDTICSVLTVDEDRCLRPLSGNSLPAALGPMIDGLPIGPDVGSCGAAASLGRPVAVLDLATDPRWAAYKAPVVAAGLRACWSSPILGAAGNAIGAFAFYYREHRGPSPREREIVATCVHLCAIAIERDQRVIDRERRATIDELTGLGNRAAFNALLVGLPCADPGRWALMAVDLDNLKAVNDTFGHRVGDQLIRCVAQRIAAAAAPDIAFRLGGDEFAIVLRAPPALQDLGVTAGRILDAIGQPAECAGYHIVPGATIGGAALVAGDTDPETVRQNADYALYHAKEVGRGGFIRYWPGLGSAMASRAGAIREVEAALRENRIDAHYQPVVDLDTREIVGFEALCRLTTPRGEIIPAAAFQQATSDIHIASGLTQRMLRIIAGDIARWNAQGASFPRVSVNVASADVHSGTLETMLCAAFDEAGVPLSHLIVEVTESVHMDRRAEVVARVLESLRAKGMQVALDDFGTGYASLTHLLAVPVNIIKIDRSFVRRLEPFSGSAAIVQGLIAIAKALNIKVVAEGIETEAQCRQLKDYGCSFGQGWLFSKAVDRARATALMLGMAALDRQSPPVTPVSGQPVSGQPGSGKPGSGVSRAA